MSGDCVGLDSEHVDTCDCVGLDGEQVDTCDCLGLNGEHVDTCLVTVWTWMVSMWTCVW